MGESNDATPIPNEHLFNPTLKSEDTLPTLPAPKSDPTLRLEPPPEAPSRPEPPFDPKLRTQAYLPEAPPPSKPARLLSLDAFRGAIMILLASHALDIPDLVKGPFKGDPTWQAIADQLDHREWIGCTVWDMIQPCFIFMVGVAMPYSYASRKAKGEKDDLIFLHTLWRSAVLVALGVFLASVGKNETQFIFTNVLAQIGLGYSFVFLMLNWRRSLQWAALAGILIGYWALFEFVTVPPRQSAPPVPIVSIAGDANLEQGIRNLTDKLAHPEKFLDLGVGLSGRWQKNANFASDVDDWFLNWFPRSNPASLERNKGGYTTLNFVPSMATMLLGVIAGQWLRLPRSAATKLTLLIGVGGLCIGLGLLAGAGPDGPWSLNALCPLVKRIWTPSWALYSGGLAMLILAAFYLLVDVFPDWTGWAFALVAARAIGMTSVVAFLGRWLRGCWKWWTFPLVVVGMNSIAMYLMGQLLRPWVRGTLQTHLASEWIQKATTEWFGNSFHHYVFAWTMDKADLKKIGNHAFYGVYGPMIDSLLILGVFWLICLWMYRRKLFLKV